MKKLFFLFWSLLFFSVSVIAQDQIDRFRLICYHVIIIPSDTFYVDIKNPTLGEKKISGNSLQLEIIDQQGRFPKDTVIIYTNKLKSLYLHNSRVEMNECFYTDSLVVSGVCAFGKLNVQSNYLSVGLSAGSKMEVEGDCDYLKSNIRASSVLKATSLITQKAHVTVAAHSGLTVNAKEIVEQDVADDSTIRNVYKQNN